MKKAFLLFGILIMIVAIIIFKMNNISKGKLVFKLDENIDFVESNEILITDNSIFINEKLDDISTRLKRG